MKSALFFLNSVDAELPAVQFDDGTWYFSAQETCVFAGLAVRSNASKWVRSNIPSKWTQEIKISEGSGRPGLYLTKPGFLFAVCQGKTEVAIKLRDEVFEVILPKIDSEGGYIMPSATQQQLQALQAQLDRQLKINDAWEQHLCNVINESHKLGKLSKYRRNVDPVANAQIDLCGFAHFAIQHKDLMKAVVENWRLAKGTGKWQRVDHLKFVFESITNQYVPVSVLTAWLQEWDFDLRSTVSDVHNVVIWEVKLRKLPSASDEKEIRQLREDLSCDRFKDTWISPGMPPQYLLT